MSEFKGTPGPWFWVTDKHNQATSLQQSGTGARVVDPQVDDGDYGLSSHCWNDVSEADARLIAAAPELLEVCREIDRLSLVIDSAVRFSDSRRNYMQVSKALTKSRAAISRALGEG